MNRRLWAQPHHDGSPAYVDNAAPRAGDVVPVRLRVPREYGPCRPAVRYVEDGEPRTVPAVLDDESEHEVWWRAGVPVVNPVTSYRWLLDGGPYGYGWLTAAGMVERDTGDGTDFRLMTHGTAPAWAADAVVYQIFPDRFARAVDRPLPAWSHPAGWDDPVDGTDPVQLYGGDLDGVIAHLDHIQELGATAVYLTPIYPAESNHRYNATDFDRVDPLLGGDEALLRLAEAVRARGMRLLCDLTTNHCGDTHAWFRTALADPGSVERGFFHFGPGDEYACWLGYETLPKFDHRNPELRRRLYEGTDSVLARWLRPPVAIDGWRIDVANMTGRYTDIDLNLEVARAVRNGVTAARPDALLIAEHFHDYSRDLPGDGWHGSMNYAGFARPVTTWLTPPERAARGRPFPPRLPGPAIVATMREFLAAPPWPVSAAHFTVLSSHDTPRLRTLFGSAEVVEVALGLLFTLPGIPMLYAGDEIGLTGVDGEDGRVPFPWDEQRWDTATLAAVRRLAGVRREHAPLRHGGLRWLAVDDDVLVFLRETRQGSVLVQAARADHPPVELPAWVLGLAAYPDPREAAAVDGVGIAEGLAGTPDLTPRDGVVTLPADGPAVRLWSLPPTV